MLERRILGIVFTYSGRAAAQIDRMSDEERIDYRLCEVALAVNPEHDDTTADETELEFYTTEERVAVFNDFTFIYSIPSPSEIVIIFIDSFHPARLQDI